MTVEFLDLNTWRVVGRDHWIRVSMPNSVIALINKNVKNEVSSKDSQLFIINDDGNENF